MGNHVPVLLDEVLHQLAIRPDGVYIDCTFGRGGHSQAILDQLGPEGLVFGLDRDPEAVRVGEQLSQQDPRFYIEHKSFGQLGAFLESRQLSGKVSGVLFDLGVSSPQLEDARRGFSFLHDGPLDMRMDPSSGMPAETWINSASEQEIAGVLFRYGEERASRKIARAICEQRKSSSITTTGQLAALIEEVLPRRSHGKGKGKTRHPATRSFQAIRIFVNQELDEISLALTAALESLAVGGRLCVISFHSLEDRIVKRFFREGARVDPALAGLPVVPDSALPSLTLPSRAIRAAEPELENNPRARSAILRVAERLA